MKKTKFKHLDLFSGIGGFALAASWVWGEQHEIVSFCEIEKFPQKVLKKHWPDVPIHDDIKTMKGDKYGRISLLTGGFPCQPYSVAGKQRGKEDDRALWPEMFRIIKEAKPDWIIGENVAGFINMGLDDLLSDLETQGYETTAFIIPACGVDAKHRRERIFIVGNSKHNGLLTKQELRSNEKASNQWGQKKQEKTREPKGADRSINVPSLQRCEDGGESNVAYAEQSRPQTCRTKRTIRADCKGDKSTNNVKSRSDKRRVKTKKDGKQKRWVIEPSVGRVADGIPSRVDRIKGLGNAIVPQVVVPIMEAIKEIEESI